ncbi:MAG: DUF3825 domain-containing protein [Thermomicrobiales bacterium]
MAEASLVGTVIWYDYKNGWGKIQPHGTTEEVFVHCTSILTPEPKILMIGEAVSFEKGQNDRGPVATNVQRLETRIRGTVDSFNKARGFGHIVDDTGKQYWVHHTHIIGGRYRVLEPKELVEFTPEQSPKGPQAMRVWRYDTRLSLDRFAVLGDLNRRLEELARLAQEESWDYKFTESPTPRPILQSYLYHTFDRLEKEGKIAVTMDGTRRLSAFNTGLVTELQEQIFALFGEHRRSNPQAPEWQLIEFVTESDRRLTVFPERPDIANYFTDPADLIYDSNIELVVDLPHVVNDNRNRFPPELRSNDYLMQSTLNAALSSAKRRVRGNYKAAIPQYHHDRLQLLLPLCLLKPNRADLALVVDRQNHVYYGSTVLPLDWAYKNARLIARPDREWLEP